MLLLLSSCWASVVRVPFLTFCDRVSSVCLQVMQPILADADRDPALRLGLLKLLDDLLEDQQTAGAFGGSHAALTLQALLLPPLVWRAGKVNCRAAVLPCVFPLLFHWCCAVQVFAHDVQIKWRQLQPLSQCLLHLDSARLAYSYPRQLIIDADLEPCIGAWSRFSFEHQLALCCLDCSAGCMSSCLNVPCQSTRPSH